jgi:hypothetical protein
MKKDILWDQMKDNVVKTKNKPPIWEGFIPPIKMVMTGGWFMALFYPHQSIRIRIAWFIIG